MATYRCDSENARYDLNMETGRGLIEGEATDPLQVGAFGSENEVSLWTG